MTGCVTCRYRLPPVTHSLIAFQNNPPLSVNLDPELQVGSIRVVSVFWICQLAGNRTGAELPTVYLAMKLPE